MTAPPLQECARDWGPAATYPWRVLVACVLCNQTPGARAGPVARALLRRWPTPAALAAADRQHVAALVRPLGLVNRAHTLRRLSAEWRPDAPVTDLRGVGSYALQAHQIFVEGRRDLAPDDHVLRAWLDHLNNHTPPPKESPVTATTTTTEKARADAGETTPKAAKPAGRNRPKPPPPLSEEAATEQMKHGLDAAGLPTDTELTPEQRERAIHWPKGLRNGALRTYIVEGKTLKQQTEIAVNNRKRTARAAKTNGAAKPNTRKSPYGDEIRAAVKLAVAARGTKHGAPGPKQHAAVRAELPSPLTVPAVLEAAGVKSERELRDIASGGSDRESLKALRPFASRFTDQFCRGRNLASILVAALEQVKSAREAT